MSESPGYFKLARVLAGVLGTLGLVRLYHEFILRQGSELPYWFRDHLGWRLVLIGLAIVVSSCVAWWVVRRLGRRLVIPMAMVAGAITTAAYSSISGMLVGVVVGIWFAWDGLRRSTTRCLLWSVREFVPILLIAVVAGLLASIFYFSESSYGRWSSRAAYAIGAGLAILWVIARTRRIRLSDVDAAGVRTNTSARPAIKAYFWPIVFTSIWFVVGVWFGWQADIHRRIWILRRVGYVGASMPGSLRDLLQSGPYIPWDIILWKEADDSHLGLLRCFADRLHYLGLKDSRITDDGMRHIRSFRSLVSLRIQNTPIGDAGFEFVAGLPSLQHLYVEKTRITRDSFRVLATLPKLDYLRFRDVLPQGGGLGGVSLAKGLRWVDLDNCGITDADLEGLSQATFLNFLSLVNNQIEGPGLVHLSNHNQLATLRLGDNPLDDRYLASLVHLPLNDLDINGVAIGPAGCRAISQLRWLQSISLRRTGVTDSQFRAISAATPIRDASLDGSKISPRALIGWSQRDVNIYLEGQSLMAKDVQRLAELGPDVTLRNCQLDAGAVAEFANHRRIFQLINCQTEERFEQPLARYAAVRRESE